MKFISRICIINSIIKLDHTSFVSDFLNHMNMYLSIIFFLGKEYILIREMIISDKFCDRNSPIIITSTKKRKNPCKIWLCMYIEYMNRISLIYETADISIYDASIRKCTIKNEVIIITHTFIKDHLKNLDSSTRIFFCIVSSILWHPLADLIQVDNIVR